MCAPTPREAINVHVGLVPPWQMTGILAKAVMDVTSITEAAPTNALTATVRCSVSVLKVESIHIWQFFALVFCYLLFDKVEKILKGSLDSISSPSPSMKIQINCLLGVKAKHCGALSKNF